MLRQREGTAAALAPLRATGSSLNFHCVGGRHFRTVSGERVMSEFHFYEPRLGHGLPHDPFKAIVAPRPIGWISTVGPDGRTNLAPYSFFNAVHSRPPMLAFTSETMKHSAGIAI